MIDSTKRQPATSDTHSCSSLATVDGWSRDTMMFTSLTVATDFNLVLVDLPITGDKHYGPRQGDGDRDGSARVALAEPPGRADAEASTVSISS